MKVFLELVDELLENNHQALIFSQYVGYLRLVRLELALLTSIWMEARLPFSARARCKRSKKGRIRYFY